MRKILIALIMFASTLFAPVALAATPAQAATCNYYVKSVQTEYVVNHDETDPTVGYTQFTMRVGYWDCGVYAKFDKLMFDLIDGGRCGFYQGVRANPNAIAGYNGGEQVRYCQDDDPRDTMVWNPTQANPIYVSDDPARRCVAWSVVWMINNRQDKNMTTPSVCINPLATPRTQANLKAAKPHAW